MICKATGDCRILVLNYNGKDLLEKFLSSVVRSAEASRYRCAVTVLDNGSTDGSTDFVRSRFTEVGIYVSRENKVLCSYNEALKNIQEDIVILLNNDIKTDLHFVDPLVDRLLREKDAFFVATHGDRSRIKFHWGILSADISYPSHEALSGERGYAFSAGIAAFNRRKFLEIDGYDEIYLPGLYEDVDLCYRGWKRGWKGYYEPDSRKFHVGSASFRKRYSPKEMQKLAFRNGVIFMIKNITDVSIFIRFAFFLLARLGAALFLAKGFLLEGFIEAMGRLPKVLESRRRARKHFILKDQEICRLFTV